MIKSYNKCTVTIHLRGLHIPLSATLPYTLLKHIPKGEGASVVFFVIGVIFKRNIYVIKE